MNRLAKLPFVIDFKNKSETWSHFVYNKTQWFYNFTIAFCSTQPPFSHVENGCVQILATPGFTRHTSRPYCNHYGKSVQSRLHWWRSVQKTGVMATSAWLFLGLSRARAPTLKIAIQKETEFEFKMSRKRNRYTNTRKKIWVQEKILNLKKNYMTCFFCILLHVAMHYVTLAT